MALRRSGPTSARRPVVASAFSSHLVVDGSNIATEGRELPSLTQLDEAVQAFMAEFGPQIVTVVVDASFPNRIARSERQTYEDAVVAGEIITPPAGAIGRGDAFILQIADRANATILSNDSFQEFHGQYDWLFDPGRLVGGKPVPHVGWVFVDRTPVRGPTSRRAVSMAKQVAAGQAPAVPKARAAKADKGAKATRAAKATKAAEATEATEPTKPAKAQKATKAAKAAKTTKATKATRATKAPQPARAPEPTPAPPPAPDPKRGGPPAGDLPPGHNEALPFIEFVGAHPVGTRVDGSVEQFSSHGAYVRADGILGYAPLKYLADPAPRSARQVLRAGESRSFVVVAVDPARRGVDLALPGIPLAGAAPPPSAPAPDVVEPPAEPKAARRGRASRKPTAAEPEPAVEPAQGRRSRASKAAKASAEKPTEATKATKTAKQATKATKASKATKATKATKKAAAAEKATAKTAAVTKKAARPRKAAGSRKAAPTPASGAAADQ